MTGTKPTPEQIAEIVRLHGLWVRGNPGGVRADLTGADLTGAYLTGANLTGANLTGAYLAGAYLTGANLAGADLTGADLTGAYLTGAYLTVAYLTGAYLTGANLTGAYLTGANLTDAIGADLARALTTITPAGELIVWKKCRGGLVVKLLVPTEARRSNATGRKCRAESVRVLAIECADGRPFNGPAESLRHTRTPYVVGETVRAHWFDPDRFNECAGGIHFFLTREEAVAYDD